MRILHTMIRVRDLDKSIHFYTEILGMKILKRKEFPEGKFTLVFVGYGEIADEAVIELTYNWETDDYEHGNAFGHIAIEVDDVYEATDQIQKAGGEVTRPAGPMKGSTTILSFVNDPDGYSIELIGKKVLH